MHKWGIGLVEEALVLLNRHANVACVCSARSLLRPPTLPRGRAGEGRHRTCVEAASSKDWESAAIPRAVDMPLAPQVEDPS